MGSIAAAACVAAFVCFAGGRPAARQTANFPLASLTVARKALPAGCALATSRVEPVGEDNLRIDTWAGLPIPNNPWIGTDRPTMAAIQARTLDPLPTPDAPPLTKKETAGMTMRRLEGVEEAYVAIYREAGPSSIMVTAIRYDQASHVPFIAPYPRADRLRFVAGRTVVAVSESQGKCSLAIADHVRHVVKAASR